MRFCNWERFVGMQRSLRGRPDEGFYEELFGSESDSDWSDSSDANDEDAIVRYTLQLITCSQYIYHFFNI